MDDFETALFHQLICTTKPIVFDTTDLNGKNPNTKSLDFSHCETLRVGVASLGSGHEKVLTRDYKGYSRLTSCLDLCSFKCPSATLENTIRTQRTSARLSTIGISRERIRFERHLNDMFGPGHSATIGRNGFIVTRNGVTVPGFHVDYIRGSLGKPKHGELVKTFPDVRHISLEELTKKLFKHSLVHPQGVEL